MDAPALTTTQLRLRTVRHQPEPLEGDYGGSSVTLDAVLCHGKKQQAELDWLTSSMRTQSETSITSSILSLISSGSDGSDGESFEFWSLSRHDACEQDGFSTYKHSRESSGISSASHSRSPSTTADMCSSPVKWPTTSSDSPPSTPSTPFRRLRAVSRTLSDLSNRDARPLATSYLYPLYIRCTDAMIAVSFVFSFFAYWISWIAPLPKSVKRPFAWITYGSIHRLLNAVGPLGNFLQDLTSKEQHVSVRDVVRRLLKESRGFMVELARIFITLAAAVIGFRYMLRALP